MPSISRCPNSTAVVIFEHDGTSNSLSHTQQHASLTRLGFNSMAGLCICAADGMSWYDVARLRGVLQSNTQRARCYTPSLYHLSVHRRERSPPTRVHQPVHCRPTSCDRSGRHAPHSTTATSVLGHVSCNLRSILTASIILRMSYSSTCSR